MYCPSCQAELPDDAHFCIECGVILDRATTGPTLHLEPAVQGQIVCAVCGTSNPGHAIFCVRCGQRMGDPVAQQVSPPPLFSGDVITNPPVMPQVGSSPLPSMGRSRDWKIASIATLLIGLGLLLFFSKFFWPGILVVIGLSNFVRSAGKGRMDAGLRSILWLFGLAILFMLPKLFIPGIFLLVALNAILEAVIHSAGQP